MSSDGVGLVVGGGRMASMSNSTLSGIALDLFGSRRIRSDASARNDRGRRRATFVDTAGGADVVVGYSNRHERGRKRAGKAGEYKPWQY